MDLTITTDWILTSFTQTFYSNGNGDATLICDYNNYYWLKLALNSMKIEYSEFEFEIDSHLNFETHFEFKIEAIKEECPGVYETLLNLNNSNEKFYKNRKLLSSDNYIRTNNTKLTFTECENFVDKDIISNGNLSLLAENMCNNKTSVNIKGFIEIDNILYFNIDDDFFNMKNEKYFV